jgi:hypothetical protein
MSDGLERDDDGDDDKRVPDDARVLSLDASEHVPPPVALPL